jgi:hypothetical protein
MSAPPVTANQNKCQKIEAARIAKRATTSHKGADTLKHHFLPPPSGRNILTFSGRKVQRAGQGLLGRLTKGIEPLGG